MKYNTWSYCTLPIAEVRLLNPLGNPINLFMYLFICSATHTSKALAVNADPSPIPSHKVTHAYGVGVGTVDILYL